MQTRRHSFVTIIHQSECNIFSLKIWTKVIYTTPSNEQKFFLVQRVQGGHRTFDLNGGKTVPITDELSLLCQEQKLYSFIFINFVWNLSMHRKEHVRSRAPSRAYWNERFLLLKGFLLHNSQGQIKFIVTFSVPMQRYGILKANSSIYKLLLSSQTKWYDTF